MKTLSVACFLCLFSFSAATEAIDSRVAIYTDSLKFCSGSLISTTFVITTAECVIKAFEVQVALGVDNLYKFNKITFIIRRSSIFTNPDYAQNDFNCANVALLQIPDLAKKNYEVNFLSLPESSTNSGSYSMSGFNLLTGEPKLLEVETNFIQNNTLECTFFSLQENEDVENFANQGSPLIDNNILMGMVTKNQVSKFFGLEMKPLVEWIRQFLNNA